LFVIYGEGLFKVGIEFLNPSALFFKASPLGVVFVGHASGSPSCGAHFGNGVGCEVVAIPLIPVGQTAIIVPVGLSVLFVIPGIHVLHRISRIVLLDPAALVFPRSELLVVFVGLGAIRRFLYVGDGGKFVGEFIVVLIVVIVVVPS